MAIFIGNTTSDTITGTSSADSIYGSGGSDLLSGQPGNDVIWGDMLPPNTTPLGQEILVNTTTAGSQATPEIIALNNGGVLAIWVSAATQAAPGLVFGQFLDATGGFVGAEFQISTDNSGGLANDVIHFNPPNAVQLSNGNVLVTWTNENPSGGAQYSVFGSIYDVNGVPQTNGVTGTTGAFLLTDEADSSWQIGTSVATDPTGGFHLIFQPANSTLGDGYDVAQRFFDATGVATGPSSIVTTYTTWDQGNGEIANLAGGGSVVVWLSLEQGEVGSADGYHASNIYMQLLNDDGTPKLNSVETLVHPNAADDAQLNPSVTALPDGTFVVTWHSWDYDGDQYGIFASHFQADGTGGSPYLVNQTTNDQQRISDITALAGGGYVIAWQSENQDGDGSGIYYRVYDANDVATTPETLATTTTAGDQMTPAIAALTGGGFAISWVSASGQDGDDAGVYIQYFNADGSVQSTDGDDLISGGAGNDEIHGNGGDDVINGNAGKDMLFGENGNDFLSGNAGADILKGGQGDDVLYGNNGTDKLKGNAGSDFLDGGNGQDKLWGGSGIDLLTGSNGNDRLVGGKGGDDLFGGSGRDKLFGGGGADHLFGDGGQDYLTGGAGADEFVFNDPSDSALGANMDHITDFVSGLDTINLGGIDADTNTVQDDAFTGVFANAFSGTAGELLYQNGILSGDVDGDGFADFDISIDGAPALAISDFAIL